MLMLLREKKILGVGAVVLFSTRIRSASITDILLCNKITNFLPFTPYLPSTMSIIRRAGHRLIQAYDGAFLLSRSKFTSHRNAVA